MADLIQSFLKPAMEELGQITVVAIKRQFNYICCFNSNIQSLKDEAKNLEEARLGLQMDVEAAANNAEVILPEVKTWLENANNKIQADMVGIDGEIPTLKNGCWGMKQRYLVSKKAVKITGEMKQLMENRSKFNDHISTPAPPAAQTPIQSGTTYHEFQSRKQIQEEIMQALRAREVRMIGICGMGGVGKTTMAKNIMNKVREEDLFDEVVMAVVSQPVDMFNIQKVIAEALGMKLNEETLPGIAHQLHLRLMGNKRILIVLDDVWEKLKFEDLGIPCGNELHKGCTILITSRNWDVLKKMNMNAENIYGVQILFETEAWVLFREIVGSCVDDPNLLSKAKQVANECKGLPIALDTVGGALKDETSIIIWEDALQQLQSSNPKNISDVIKDVYIPLKLSYTYLQSRDAKSLFLLCSVFPEDVNISLEELTSYCIGSRMFCDLDFSNTSEGTLEKVRKRVFTIVNTLKNRFLLLKGEDEHHVRMHDVVRDVAIYIASNEAEDVKFNSVCSSREHTYEWVSVFSGETSSLLRMHASNDRDKYFEIKDLSIFEEIKELNLLSFEHILLKSLPVDMQLLKNLRTLRLKDCGLESLSVVGHLLSLEILYCYCCDGIEELPVEIGKLKQLKLLDFSYCRSLRRIPPGVISNLVELEEFKMLQSFSGWELAAEVQGQERRNASLNEFEKLSKLTCLEIEINDLDLAAEEIRFSPNIVRYQIQIGDAECFDPSPSREKYMFMNLPRDINLGGWVLRFLKSADELDLMGDGSNSLDLPQAHNMKSMTFGDCSTVKKLVNSTTSIDDLSKFDVFPILEYFYLYDLPNLEEIYDGTVLNQSNSFKNLKRLYLYDVPALKHLCRRPSKNVSLNNLREIDIQKCNNLLNLFSLTMANDVSLQLDRQNPNVSTGIDQISTGGHVNDFLCTQKVLFPMLESLYLRELDKLEVIWNGPIPEGSNSFKNLRKLQLFNLSAMTHLWKSPSQNVSLSNLSKICINGCHKLRNLFSLAMSMDFLLQLGHLEIKSCKMMEEVLLNEENVNQCGTIQFPKLSKLTLDSLESLTAFSKRIENIEFPVLDYMHIGGCPELISLLSSAGNNQNSASGHDDDTFHYFCSQTVSFGSLKEISISSYVRSNMWCHQIPLDFFSQLEKLEIEDCNGIGSLFPSSIAESLVNLVRLTIKGCKEIVKVVEDNEEMSCEKAHLLFPSLNYLSLNDLPKLQSFCNLRCDLQLPSLEKVDIENCPLEFFTMESVSTPNLNRLKINRASKDVGDLNGAIQLHFGASDLQLFFTTP